MRIRQILIIPALLGAVAASAGAQGTPEKKPGGLNKVARDVSGTVKKAGRDTKAETKRVASRSHQTLRKAGNDTKAELKRTTGYTTPAPTPDHRPGGLNKVARDVSHAGKKTGAAVKHETKKTTSAAHQTLKTTGREAKEELKKP